MKDIVALIKKLKNEIPALQDNETMDELENSISMEEGAGVEGEDYIAEPGMEVEIGIEPPSAEELGEEDAAAMLSFMDDEEKAGEELPEEDMSKMNMKKMKRKGGPTRKNLMMDETAKKPGKITGGL